MKVLVLGGGVVGVTSAYFLAKEGHEVVVIDQHDQVGQEATAVNAGLIAPGHCFAWASPSAPKMLVKSLFGEKTSIRVKLTTDPRFYWWGLQFLRECTSKRARANTLAKLTLADYSQRKLNEVAATESIDYDQVSKGLLYLYRDASELELGLMKMELLTTNGVKLNRLDADQLAQVEPAFANSEVELAGAIHAPDDASGNSELFSRELRERCERMGVEFRFGITAQKFTEHGGVTVRMSYVPATKRGAAGALTIDVADTGVGIAQKDQRTIFKAFQQADSSTTRRFGGTGLGLSIARELARLMGGNIEVQSTPGAGTVFTVTLPAEVATVEEAQAAARPVTDARTLTIAPEPIGLPDAGLQTSPPQAVSVATQTSKPRPRVLVVDDQPTNLMVIEDQLHTLGCDVELAADGAQALERAAAQTFDLILMDCYLPDIDGYAVTARIRARETDAGTHTPILAISAAVDDEHQQRVMESGMDGMLTKPIRLDALREMIELWCDVAYGDDSQNAPRVATPALAGEGRDLWSIYLDSLDDDLESLAHALDARDPTAARYVAHRIKGAALTVEQAAIAERARVLEAALAQAGAIPADAPAALAELRSQRDQLHADSTVG